MGALSPSGGPVRDGSRCMSKDSSSHREDSQQNCIPAVWVDRPKIGEQPFIRRPWVMNPRHQGVSRESLCCPTLKCSFCSDAPGHRGQLPTPGSHRTWRAVFPHHALRQVVHSTLLLFAPGSFPRSASSSLCIEGCHSLCMEPASPQNESSVASRFPL